MALVPAGRQADSLYVAGVFDQARAAYMRLLDSDLASEAPMELRYKIGMCFLRQAAYSQARAWMEKVVALPEEAFWHEQAALALLDLDWQQKRQQAFIQEKEGMQPVIAADEDDSPFDIVPDEPKGKTRRRGRAAHIQDLEETAPDKEAAPQKTEPEAPPQEEPAESGAART